MDTGPEDPQAAEPVEIILADDDDAVAPPSSWDIEAHADSDDVWAGVEVGDER